MWRTHAIVEQGYIALPFSGSCADADNPVVSPAMATDQHMPAIAITVSAPKGTSTPLCVKLAVDLVQSRDSRILVPEAGMMVLIAFLEPW